MGSSFAISGHCVCLALCAGVFNICSIIVAAARRGRGYGADALELLCREAGAVGIIEIYDDIAAGNRSLGLFLRHGFSVVSSGDGAVLVKRQL